MDKWTCRWTVETLIDPTQNSINKRGKRWLSLFTYRHIGVSRGMGGVPSAVESRPSTVVFTIHGRVNTACKKYSDCILLAHTRWQTRRKVYNWRECHRLHGCVHIAGWTDIEFIAYIVCWSLFKQSGERYIGEWPTVVLARPFGWTVRRLTYIPGFLQEEEGGRCLLHHSLI